MPNSKEYKKFKFAPKNNKERVFSILSGQSDLPGNMFIGGICGKEHGLFGKSVRYKSNHNCIRCEFDNRARNSKKAIAMNKDNRSKAALDIYDIKQSEDDWWGDET